MLDVARHFRSVRDVKRFVDLIALYKLNRLHLHLSDDQGWRIAIAEVAAARDARRQHGGRRRQGRVLHPGAVLRHRPLRRRAVRDDRARDRHAGHVHAALSSYPKLACDGKPSPLYTGMNVGFCSLCIDKDAHLRLRLRRGRGDRAADARAVVPHRRRRGDGDEAGATTSSSSSACRRSSSRTGSTWSAGRRSRARSSTRRRSSQHWNTDPRRSRSRRGGEAGREGDHVAGRARLSGHEVRRVHADRAAVGRVHDRAGLVRVGPVRAGARAWRRGTCWASRRRSGARRCSRSRDAEYLAFPRLIGIAEIGWSPARGRSWAEYRLRLGAQGPLLDALGVNFYRSPEVPWR